MGWFSKNKKVEEKVSGKKYLSAISGNYEATRNSVFRSLYGYWWSQKEADMLPSQSRENMIAYIRNAMRNDPRVSGILLRYGLGIGVPTPHVSFSTEPKINDAIERALLKQMRSIRWGVPQMAASFGRMLLVIYNELNIGGECFVVKMRDGKLRIIPSEFCGSPADCQSWENDGIIYASNGNVKSYRFGKRKNGVISFENDSSTIVPAEHVWHLGTSTRAEEIRPVPRLAPAICAIQDLKDLVNAKVNQVKNQSILSWFITKNIPGELAAELAATQNNDAEWLSDFIQARTSYQKLPPNGVMYGEAGEGIQTMESKFASADYDAFVVTNLDFVCAPLGIPPEEAIMGYRRSNYSSSRAEKLRWRQKIDDERRDLMPFIEDCQKWMLQMAMFDGSLTVVSDLNIEEIIEKTEWVFPPLPEIDENKAVAADQIKLTAGLASRREIAAGRGKFADDITREQVADAVATIKCVRDAASINSISEKEIYALLPNSQEIPQIFVEENLEKNP